MRQFVNSPVGSFVVASCDALATQMRKLSKSLDELGRLTNEALTILSEEDIDMAAVRNIRNKVEEVRARMVQNGGEAPATRIEAFMSEVDGLFTDAATKVGLQTAVRSYENMMSNVLPKALEGTLDRAAIDHWCACVTDAESAGITTLCNADAERQWAHRRGDRRPAAARFRLVSRRFGFMLAIFRLRFSLACLPLSFLPGRPEASC